MYFHTIYNYQLLNATSYSMYILAVKIELLRHTEVALIESIAEELA